MNCVLINTHMMVGTDLHKELAPPPAPPVPFFPHIVAATLQWLMLPAMAPKVLSQGMPSMKRGTDIMSGIPHLPIPPAPYNLNIAIYLAFSGSKAEFGVATVQVGGSPVAVAAIICVNLNLNCGDVPTPSGVVVAGNTVVASMTLADYLGGLFAMAADCLIQYACSVFLGGAGINSWGEGILAMLIGTPLGFSFNSQGTGPIGFMGRAFGSLSDFARGIGESLGGDSATGQATRDAAVQTLNNNFVTSAPNAALFVVSPIVGVLKGWDAGSDINTIFDRPIQLFSDPSPSPASGSGTSASPSSGPDATSSQGTGPSSGTSSSQGVTPRSPALDNPQAEEL